MPFDLGCFWVELVEGKLSCVGHSSKIPSGSYLKHCKACVQSDGVLTCAKCMNGDEEVPDAKLQESNCHWVYFSKGELACQAPFISVDLADYSKVRFGKDSFPKKMHRLWVVSQAPPTEQLQKGLAPFHGKVWTLHLKLDKNESNTQQDNVLAQLHKLFDVTGTELGETYFLHQSSGGAKNAHVHLADVAGTTEAEMVPSLVEKLAARLEQLDAPKKKKDEL